MRIRNSGLLFGTVEDLTKSDESEFTEKSFRSLLFELL